MCEIVASIPARDPARTLESARRAAVEGADRLELRLDEWPADADLAALIAALPLPVIAACRLPRDGGSWSASPAERVALLEHALRAGATGLDLEDWEPWRPAHRPELLIRSHHDLDGCPADLRGLHARLAAGADRVKIVVTLDDLADAGPLLELSAGRGVPTVAFALGEACAPTRVLAAAWGAPMVYGCVTHDAATAPGQPTVAELRDRYAVRSIGPGTAVFGVVGNPARHSFGPLLHNALFRERGLDAVYLALETARPDDLVAMLGDRLHGLSVTSPFKEWAVRVAPAKGGKEPVLCFAANTLVRASDGATWVAHNTDIVGVRGALARAGIAAEPGDSAAVLGGGPAGRSAACALAGMGFEVTVLARRASSTLVACATHNGWRVAALDAGQLRAAAPRVVVHATSAGMDRPTERLLPEWEPRVAAVLDMVYRPARTKLLREAEAAGAIAIGGIEMFVEQAAAQVALFTGERPDGAALRELLR